jgi:hypothetical protein
MPILSDGQPATKPIRYLKALPGRARNTSIQLRKIFAPDRLLLS